MIGMVKRLVQGTLACLCAGEVILSAQELEPDEVKVRRTNPGPGLSHSGGTCNALLKEKLEK